MEPSGSSPSFELKGRKILIVDDDRVNAGVLGGILQNEGCALAEAVSTAQALAVYAAFLPDLVVLAGKGQCLDGLACCRQLRKTHGDACAPIIFITARSEPADLVEGLDAGGVGGLPKPFNAKEVLACIRPHLQNRMLAEQLGKANAAKHRFLGMAAHDLRSPLASIRGVAEFLREGAVGPLSPDQLDLVETIHRASEQVLNLVNELLDVATIDSGELTLNLESWNLADLIAESVALTNLEAARKKIRVVFDPPDATPEFRFDAARMKQVVDNLLSNAVKYSPPGSTVTVLIHFDAAGGICTFCVQDQGRGIPEGEREKLFKDFGRLSVQTTGGEKSTGLGLVICRKIVETHHGTIVAENLPTRGCEFRVTLPATP
jgi:two-component system, sensor histidine kinase and response regulator